MGRRLKQLSAWIIALNWFQVVSWALTAAFILTMTLVYGR